MGRPLATAGAGLLLFTGELLSQSLSPIPGSLYDAAVQYPISEKFSFEQQVQAGTQGNPSYGDPFAYWHGVQIRPWFHYDGISNTTLTGSAGYIDYFNIPETSNYKHPEWRFTVFGTLKQGLSRGSLYEQLRFELLNFRDSNAVRQHLPRLRFRFGQNIYLAEGGLRPYLGLYEEGIVQFPQPSYSNVKFEGARFFAGYGFEWRAIELLLGFKAEGEVSASGSSVTLLYGPVFSIEYNFAGRLINEKHKRTTAFKDF